MSKQSDLVSVSQGSGGDPLYIDTTNDNVGIGTSSPNNYSGWTTLTIANPTNGGIIDFEDNGAVCLQLASTTSDTTFNHQQNGYMAFRTNNTERMRIDSAGIVTKPYHPIVQSSNNPTFSGGSLSTGSTAFFGTPAIAQGISYNNSTGRFTVPVSGKYLFSISLGYFLTGTDYVRDMRWYWRTNGSNSVGHAFSAPNIITGNDHGTNNAQAILNLAANDYVDFHCTYYDGGSYNADLTSISVFLLG